MTMTSRLEIRQISQLIPYENNARIHSPEQIDQLRRSIRAFGFVTPILVDAAGRVLAGHGRLEAAAAEGYTEAPCVLVEHLSDDQRRAYILADNRLAESATWDTALVSLELQTLQASGIELELTGFGEADIILGDDGHFWGDTEAEPSEEYEAFVEKFRPKKTTDDVYTPANIYEAVKTWALEHYGLGDAQVLRPFFPGGDYQAADYPDGSVVIDNPPFSILSEICRFYGEHGVQYFLFAPGTTLFSINSGNSNYVPVGVSVTYENGANVQTSFVTNLGPWRIETAPDLYAAVYACNKGNECAMTKNLPAYSYPDNLVSVSSYLLSKYGQTIKIPASDAAFVRALDAQKDAGKAIFGAGFLLSEKAAAEKAAAEKAAAEKAAAEKAAAEKAAAKIWQLSKRELDLIASLGGALNG